MQINMDVTPNWKKSDVVIPERETAPGEPTQIESLLTPATGDVSGGLDLIGAPLKDVVVKDTKPKVDLTTAINLIVIKGQDDHIKQFKLIAKSQFGEDEMGAVETPSGLPIGLVYTIIGKTQRAYPDLDLSKDKIIINVNLKKRCKKCNGRGYIGKVFDKNLKITDKLFRCMCLKTIVDVEKGQPEEKSDVDADSEPQ